MEVYSTDEERIDALKRWFGQYGKPLALGLLLAVVAIFSWRYWQTKQLNVAYQASNIYPVNPAKKSYVPVTSYEFELRVSMI